MCDSGRALVAQALQDRLPAGWTVEAVGEDGEAGDNTGGARVSGYTNDSESGGRGTADARHVAFEIRRDGDLWVATWLDRAGRSADRSVVHRITGVRERCVEWIIERTRGAEGADSE